MYKDGFVLSIMRDGRPLRESGRMVRIPFDSEYKIRLKNKLGKSCKARVTIDGTPVSQLGDFVISSWGTLDLERFVNDSLNKGKKFRFVSAKSGEVQDPTNSDNGLIRVEFYLAKNGPLIITNDDWTWHYPPYFPPNDSEVWPCDDEGGTGKKKKHLGRSVSDTYRTDGATANAFYCSTNVNFTNNITDTIPDDKGATVEGGDSNQSFMTVSDFDVELNPVVLELELRAPRDGVAPEPKRNYCSGCGAARRDRHRDRYCPQCGRKF